MLPLVKFTEIASRMTGFSFPIFALSWQSPTPDVAIARRIIAFLEDRRLLEAADYQLGNERSDASHQSSHR